jgi:GNAT superfamily N-acetyltransferase
MITGAVHQLRAATARDATALADLGQRTFRATYAADTRPEDMDAFLRGAYRPEDLAAGLADPRQRWSVAEVDGQLVGFANLVAGDAHESIIAGSPVLLGNLYLDRSAQVIGLGSAMMAHLLETAREEGHDVIWLGVWEKNPKAIAFYRRWGFFEIGSVPFTFGSERQRDLVMARSLANGAGS